MKSMEDAPVRREEPAAEENEALEQIEDLWVLMMWERFAGNKGWRHSELVEPLLKAAPSSILNTAVQHIARMRAAKIISEMSTTSPELWGTISKKISLPVESIIDRTTEVVGSREEAMRWLGTPVRALDFATPISMLTTLEGLGKVLDVLGQMEHGVW
jgi:putative toxin-antitoxin system antitoxin component (TIGR02293 family)